MLPKSGDVKVNFTLAPIFLNALFLGDYLLSPPACWYALGFEKAPYVNNFYCTFVGT